VIFDNTSETFLDMTNLELESICRSQPFSNGRAAWADWTTELYSFGFCLRDLTDYPNYLPIFATADHGARFGSLIEFHEANSSMPLFITHNLRKVERLKDLFNGDVIHAPHPWAGWRRRKFPKTEGTGSLVFVPHSNGHTDPITEISDFVNELNALDSKFHPITLCLHMHDINAGLHMLLRPHGFKLTTAGNTSNRIFVERFYSILMKHRYVLSPTIGSHTIYALEAGKEFYHLNEIPQTNSSTGNLKSPIYNYREAFDDNEEFEQFEHFVNMLNFGAKKDPEFIESYVQFALGLDSNLTSPELRNLLMSSLKKSVRRIPHLYYEQGSNLIKNYLASN
jgi:hypothetical protein